MPEKKIFKPIRLQLCEGSNIAEKSGFYRGYIDEKESLVLYGCTALQNSGFCKIKEIRCLHPRGVDSKKGR